MNDGFTQLMKAIAIEAAHYQSHGWRRDHDQYMNMLWYTHGYWIALEHNWWRPRLWAKGESVNDGDSAVERT